MTEEKIRRKKLIAEKWKNATIKNDFVFTKTMELHPEICRHLIEIILNIKIKKIDFIEREKTLKRRKDSRGIRLDVYVEDKDNNRVIDLEMQVADRKDLPKRIRYYQGLIDTESIKPGETFNKLGESYIIFICPFDPFKCDLGLYTFMETCEQKPSLKLGDGSTKLFLNTVGKFDEHSKAIKSFADYVNSQVIFGKFIERLDDAVQDIKTNRKVGREFMTYEMRLTEIELEAREKGLAEGRAEGLEEGRAEGREVGLKEGRAVGLKEGRAEGHAEGRAEGREVGLKEGRAVGLKEGRAESLVNSIRSLMKTMGLTLEDAMNALQIPKDEQSKYVTMI